MEEGKVDEGKLNEEGDGDCEEQHFVDIALEERHVETSVLKSGGEIEKDEGCESLRETVNRSASTRGSRIKSSTHHRLISSQIASISEFPRENEQDTENDHTR